MTDESLTDFGNPESCNAYLMTKFDDLLQGINNLYGKELMEELICRLEKTVAQFHKDIQSLINEIKSDETKEPFHPRISVGPQPQPSQNSADVAVTENETNERQQNLQ